MAPRRLHGVEVLAAVDPQDLFRSRGAGRHGRAGIPTGFERASHGDQSLRAFRMSTGPDVVAVARVFDDADAARRAHGEVGYQRSTDGKKGSGSA